MRVTVLGSAASMPSARRGLTANLVEVHGMKFLFDCGEGTQRALISTNNLDVSEIFLTHFHGDHILGIPGLLYTMAFMERKANLTIYGPSGVQTVLQPLLLLGNREHKSFITTVLPARENVKQLAGGEGSVQIHSFPVNHRVRAFGYSVVDMETGRKVVISGDTQPTANLIEEAKGADLLIHEATFMDQDIVLARAKGHSTARQAAQVAKEADVGNLILTHVSSRYNPLLLLREARRVFSNTLIARDETSVEI